MGCNKLQGGSVRPLRAAQYILEDGLSDIGTNVLTESEL